VSREQDLRKAVRKARLPARDFKIFTVLLDMADWGTAELPGRWQPKSLEHLADLCEMPRSTLCRGLAHLGAEGWVKRASGGGRGHANSYTLALGERCWCSRPGRPRKPETVSEYRPKPSQNKHINRPIFTEEPAGQAPVSAGGHLGGERGASAVQYHGEPACEVCGHPVSHARRAQTMRRGAVVCVPCEAADPPEAPGPPAPAEAEPTCPKCGAPESPLDSALGLPCQCEETGPPGGSIAARERRRADDDA
jgi:hypothetical protein